MANYAGGKRETRLVEISMIKIGLTTFNLISTPCFLLRDRVYPFVATLHGALWTISNGPMDMRSGLD